VTTLALNLRGRAAGRPGALGLGVSTLWLSLIVLLPLAAVVARSTEGGLDAFWSAVSSRQAVSALRFTLLVSLVATVINAVTGTLIAWILVRDRFRGKRVVNALIDLPFALPTIVAGLTLLALYGPTSPVGIDVAFTQFAVLLALLFVTLPFVIRAVQPVLIELDREMEEAALSLGANGRTVFLRVILPNLVPAILSGAALAFARAVGEFGSIVLISGNIPFETQVASMFIFKQIESDNPVGAAAISVVLLALSLLILIGIVFYRTFENGLGAVYDSVTTPAAISAFSLTLTVTAIAVPLNTIFGVLCALALARGRFRGKAVLNAIIDLPFAISPVVVGLALILVFGRGGWLGDLPFQVIFSVPGIVLATIFISVPFVVREVTPVLKEVGDEQEQAAATLGAGRWQSFWRITLPSIRWGVAYGVVLSVARCIGEFGAVSVVSGKISGETETLTLLVEKRFQNFDLAGAYAASALLAFIALATLLAMTTINPRRDDP
jgi:sulfate ABC transporter permease protein CysW/sulfate ABC transporter permease protein CysT